MGLICKIGGNITNNSPLLFLKIFRLLVRD